MSELFESLKEVLRSTIFIPTELPVEMPAERVMDTRETLGVLEVEIDEINWRTAVEVVVLEIRCLQHLDLPLPDQLRKLLEHVFVVCGFELFGFGDSRQLHMLRGGCFCQCSDNIGSSVMV